MSVLNDDALSQALSNEPPLASDTDPTDRGRKDSKIQPASVDLTIGKIIVPGIDDERPGSLDVPREELALEQGQTAVVVTLETLSVPNDISAIGFPPSSVSVAGLLMTNPGHVDPGYAGPLKFTVINMGREPYQLKKGDPIVTLVFVRMIAAARVPYNSLLPPRRSSAGAQLNEELLERLSHDFMDIDKRARRLAAEEVRKAQLTVPIISAIAGAILSGLLTFFATYWKPVDELKDRLTKIESRVDAIGSKADLGTIDKRLETLEKKLGNK